MWATLLLLLQIVQFSGAGTGGSAPTVANANFYPIASGSGGLSMPVSTGGAVGTVSASNTTSSTTWSITGGNSAGDFQIASPGTGGAITFTSQGQTDYNGSTNSKTATLTVQACNGASCASNSNIVITAYADGSPNASAGTSAQAPNLLNGYAVRPPWKVPGVDYGVGLPTGTSLTDWQSLSITGLSVNTSTNVVSCNSGVSGSITINKIDFSLHGGAIILNGSGDCTGTVTVTNSKFGCTVPASGGDGNVISQDTSVTWVFEYNTFDSTGCTYGTQGYTANYGISAANFTAKWNLYINGPGEINDLIATGTNTAVNEFNFVNNSVILDSVHQNYTQWGGNGTVTYTTNFNTTYMSNCNGGEGFQFYTNSTGGMTITPTASYNTMIAAANSGCSPSTPMSAMMHGSCHLTTDCASLPTTTISGVMNANYFDVSGAEVGAFYGTSGSTMWNNWSSTQNNINMTTGATITFPPP